MWLEDLATYIRAQNITGVGNNVFIYTLKSSDTGAMITSHNSGVLVNPQIPNYFKGPLQLIVRATTPQNSQNQAQAISDLLNSQTAQINGQSQYLKLPNTIINYCYPRHAPVVFPRSDGDYYEATVNFDICFTTIS